MVNRAATPSYKAYLEISAERPDLKPLTKEEFDEIARAWAGLSMMTTGQLAEEVNLIFQSHKGADKGPGPG